MFKDYYKILNVDKNAQFEVIKRAYYALSKKYHPDKNMKTDTTSKMQEINEAFSILKDEQKRKRYDSEYQLFINFSQGKFRERETDSNSWDYDYDIQDEKVKYDVQQAREYAKKLVDDFFLSLKETSQDAVKGFWDSIKPLLLTIMILNIIVVIIFNLYYE